METKLLNEVYEDIIQFMTTETQDVFFNERDLQMHLAIYLKKSSKKYDDVEVEYYVPVFNRNKQKILEKYNWNSEIRLDIVVEKNGEFLPVELKYKTRKAKESTCLKRFNQEVKDIDILKDQSAQDLGCYDFWKDVRRIEVIKENYEDNVKNGIAIFLTNDSFYWKEYIKEDTAYYNFRLSKDNNTTNKSWTKDVSIMEQHPNFELNNTYNSEWINKKEFNNCREVFKCFIVKV